MKKDSLKNNSSIYKLVGDNYNLIQKYAYKILDTPDYYYCDIGSFNTIDGLQETLYLGDLIQLWQTSSWENKKQQQITLAIVWLDQHQERKYYDFADKKIKTISERDEFQVLYLIPALTSIVRREHFVKDTGYDFTPVEPLSIQALIKKLKEENGNTCEILI